MEKVIKKIYHIIRWHLRKAYWKFFHVDNLDLFTHANNAESEVWSFITKNLFYLENKVRSKGTSLNVFLELGCANGRNLFLAKQNSKSLFDLKSLKGIDLNARAIQAGKRKIKKENIKGIELINSDLLKYDIDSIDIIVSVATLIYLNDKELNIFLKKIISDQVKILIILEPFKKSSELKGYTYFHDLEEFTILNSKYDSKVLNLKNLAWDKEDDVKSTSMIWTARNLDINLDELSL